MLVIPMSVCHQCINGIVCNFSYSWLQASQIIALQIKRASVTSLTMTLFECLQLHTELNLILLS